MRDKIIALVGVLVGGVGTVLALLDAYGLDVTPDQKEAIAGVASLVLLAVSAWFHPNIPVGPTDGSPD